MAVASAFLLTACTSNDDALNNQGNQTASEKVGIGFDTYVTSGSSATTRGANAYDNFGPFTDTNMKDPAEGFGVFASFYDGNKKYQDLVDEGAVPAPNFMYNQNVTFDGTAWSYAPLLYWPNQTSNTGVEGGQADGQTGNNAMTDMLDRVSFFAYAPYQPTVSDQTEGLDKASGTVYDAEGNPKAVGVKTIISNTAAAVPQIQYVMGTEPRLSEDILWGVAPYGGTNYMAVNGMPIQINYGTSYIDMVKPAVNTKIKFLFQHALTALKMSIQGAIDQVAGGGNINANTKIYVNNVTLTSNSETVGFATSGTLSLLNRMNGNAQIPNLPNWSNLTSVPLVIGGNVAINPILQSPKDADGLYTAFTNAGVTGTEVGLFANNNAAADVNEMLMFIPVLPDTYSFDAADALNVTVEVNYDVVTESADVAGGQVKVNNVIRKNISLPKFRNGRIYKLKLILGVTSVQFEAEAADWTTDAQDVELPRNLD